jgi:hypothetical protein
MRETENRSYAGKAPELWALHVPWQLPDLGALVDMRDLGQVYNAGS